jgi:Ca2+-binding EF-hand superfamily protein
MSSGMGNQSTTSEPVATVQQEEQNNISSSSSSSNDVDDDQDSQTNAKWTMADVRKATRMGMFSPTDLFETFSEMSTVQDDGTHTLTRDSFMQCVSNIITLGGGYYDENSAEIADEFFNLMCKDFESKDGFLDPRAVASGLSVLCVGQRDAKVRSAFALFDANNDGFISMDEMEKYLTSVFKVLYLASPTMESQLNGVPASSLGAVTTAQVFEQCDVNHDGRLSFEEFQKWYGSGFSS